MASTTDIQNRLAPTAAFETTFRPTDLRRRPRLAEMLIQGFLFLCGALSIFTTLGIVYVLGQESLLFFTNPEVNVGEFFTTFRWQPEIGQFGVWPLVNATLMTSLIALLVSVPLGVSAAIYLSEYATPRVRNYLKPTLEVLAGVPTVVYGFFALTFMTPLLRLIFGQETVQIYNNAAAGIVMGIMIMPLITSMSEDALSAVPRSLREAAYGLGATKLETAVQVVLPAALSGIVAAFIIGMSRAVGETMIVAIAAGMEPRLTADPREPVQTMTAYIVQVSFSERPSGSLEMQAIFAVGLMLFLSTLVFNAIAQRLRQKILRGGHT